MLWQRILTALCLIPLVLWAVISMRPLSFSVLSLSVFAWGAWEWSNLCQLKSKQIQIHVLYVICFVLISGLIAWGDCKSVLLLGSLFWCIPAYWILTYRESTPQLLQSTWGKAIIGLIVLVAAWYSLCAIQKSNLGPLWVILLFVLVWGSDTFAYFAGRKWGKTPLMASISPKKTLEGFWGGLIGTLVCAIVIFLALKTQSFAKDHLMPFSAWVSMAYVTILLAVLGDLFESLFKRLSGVKDSGRLLPGHGGLLDRIDSLLAALPFYALSLVWVLK